MILNRKRSIGLLVTILFIGNFTGCSQKEVVYVTTGCPKLQTIKAIKAYHKTNHNNKLIIEYKIIGESNER